MNNKFVSNPISIVKNGVIIDVVELYFDYEDISFLLKISTSEGNVIYDEIFNEESFINIDVELKEVIFEYYDLNKKLMYSESYNLTKKYNQTFEEVQLEMDSLDEKSLYLEVTKFVKKEMDNPKGTANEAEYHTNMLRKCTYSHNARAYVETKIRQTLTHIETLNDVQIDRYTKEIYANFYGMGILQEIDDDIEVGEILVNGFIFPKFRCDVYYYKKGKKIKHNMVFDSLDELLQVFTRAISFSNKELNNVENALIEATRANRDRVNIIIPDASESYVMNIRKFGNFVPNTDSMKEFGTVDEFIEKLLKVIVEGKANIGIGGEMGTGKTTFVNYLLTFTEPLERKVVIASVSETDVERVLKTHDIVILNVEETKGFTFTKLVRASLRTTASRIIIPESRGDEFRQVYEANLKTKGNMFTAHALDDYSFLDTCVDMYNGDNLSADVDNVRNKISKSVDVIIIMRKVGHDIRIKSISEIVLDDKKNFEKMNLLYYWESDPEDFTLGQYRRTENRLTDNIRIRLNEYGVPMSVMKDL